MKDSTLFSISARDVTRLFRTLSDETRFRLLRLLHRAELTVNELAEITQLAQPRISNHLKILREENLIAERRAGSWRHYRIELDTSDFAVQALWPSLEAAWADTATFAADDKRLAQVLAERTNRKEGSFFDDLAHRWDDIRQGLFGDALGREILRTFLPPGLIVADIGTGTGHMMELFGDRARKILAIDHSDAMLAVAREKAAVAGLSNVEFRLADVQKDDFLEPAEADVVTLVQVLHHLESPPAVFERIAAGLRPGGILILNDFLEHQERWLLTEFHHRWNGFSRIRVQGWMTDAGLRLDTWDVIPGRTMEPVEGQRVTIPDSFIATIRK